MRRLITVFILVFGLQYQGNAQSYIPLVKDSVHWFVAKVNQFNSPGTYNSIYEYYSNGDTLINSTTYKKVYKRDVEAKNNDFQAPYRPLNPYSLYGVLREDTASKRVYSIIYQSIPFFNYCSIGQEDLLYDFDMAVGDSINDSMCVATQPHPEPIIVGVTIKTFKGNPTIEYNRGGLVPAFYYQGIGNWCGLFELESSYETFILWDYCIGSDTTCGLTNSISINANNYMIKTFPNPFYDYLNIETSKNNDHLFLQIFNIHGKVVQKNYLNRTQNKINTSNIPKGIYLIKVSDQNNILYNIKMIKL